MDTHRPIDVLEDRQADTLAQWLKEHPGVQVICRDRAGAYAEGSREGAPDAIQVADRFHLWQNLCDAVEKTVISCRADLREPVPEPGDPEPAGPGSDVPAETTGPAAGQDTGNGRLATRSRERHAAIHDLLAQGKNYTQISETAGPDAPHRPQVRSRRHRRAGDHRAQPALQPARPFRPLPAAALEPGVHRRRPAVRRDPGAGLLRQQAVSAPLPAAAARRAHRSRAPAAPADRPGGDPVDHQPPRSPHRRRKSPAQPGQSPQRAAERQPPATSPHSRR